MIDKATLGDLSLNTLRFEFCSICLFCLNYICGLLFTTPLAFEIKPVISVLMFFPNTRLRRECIDLPQILEGRDDPLKFQEGKMLKPKVGG